jgi:transposase
LRAAAQDRPDVTKKRRRWHAWQAFMDPARFVFLDETGATTDMARRYGRSPKGARLVAAVPQGHWKTTTFVAGLRETGVIAPLVLDGPITGQAFRAYVEQFLAPALDPGDVVVLDNLAAHKVDGIRQAITRAGASILYLPPYRPDLNPIEQLFAKLKALLRKAAARTREELWSTIGRLLEAIPATECANYLAHSGYDNGST